MRLTLRTLLAYLDDTLEPHEIKEIGQKVAESDAAQELVARIKQVTRRRRLTTPPGGPNAKFDANTIAEYLDSELDSELVAELEKTCLESDVHLAEVASCHQILTLVLGEPALVPPTARERMYGLVKGREAIPFRKARARDGAGQGEGGDRDADDPLLPGLPSSRGWLLWVLPLAAVLVLAVLAVAVYTALPNAHPAAVAVVNPNAASPNAPADAGKGTPAPPVPPAPPVVPVQGPPNDNTPTPPVDTPNPPVVNPPMTPPPASPDDRPKPPSKVRAAVGVYEVPSRVEPSILVQRQADQPGWKRLVPGDSEVASTDELVSLPGYNSELALGRDRGVRLLLHGHVPQFSVDPILDYLLESAVHLYQPEPGFDADLTLDRGRIYLSNHKGKDPARVRLRFAGEVWDLTLLDPDTKVGVALIQTYLPDINYLDEPPYRTLDLVILSGRAGVKIDSLDYADLPTRAQIRWDNKHRGATSPRPVAPQDWPLYLAVWSETPTQPAGANQAELAAIAHMSAALDSLSKLMTEKKVEGALLEARGTPDQPMLRVLAVYSFGAIDLVDRALDVLCTDENEAHTDDRAAAILTLRRWIGRDQANGPLLYNDDKDTGSLLDVHHLVTPDARNVFVLLHDFPSQDLRQPATFERLTSLLRHKQLPIRELAYWWLLHLSVGARLPPNTPLPAYNAAWGSDQREPSVGAWKALIEKGVLPPQPPMAPPGQ